jgi:alkylation response protein AidB-like acyl-CoA dehydrogenase
MSATDRNASSGIGERSMGYGLRALGRIAGSRTLDRIGMRKHVQRAIYRGSKTGFRSATAAGRTFKAAQTLGRPARQAATKPKGLFDITPDEEQQMLCEAVRDYAAEKIRPAAAEADSACATPAELLREIEELGINTLGIPEELGGVMHEQAAVTSVLVAEALAHGDMGIAYAALAPGALASAIGRWGTAEQQATYLPEFTREHPPVGALAILEPQPLFDPLELNTTARQDGEDWVLDGTKALLARPGDCELFLVAAHAQGLGPALFLIESAIAGLTVSPEPAMGLRAAATGRLTLQNVRLGASSLIGEGAPGIYNECVQRSRIAWCALAVGAAQAVLDHVIPYVNERSAFGEPISNRQAVAFAVSDIAIETAGMRLLTQRAASRADEGRSFAREAALARQLCSAYAARIGSEGVQLLGGHGYIKEHPVERWYRDLRAAGVMEGALLA